MNRKTRVLRCFLVLGILILGLTLGMTCRKKNQPPGAPSIPSGPTSGRKGDTLRFSTVAEDPDGDSVEVRFDWGDSAVSDWSPLVPSGDSVVMTHAWQKLATYSIRAQVRDAGETTSVWSGQHQLTVASFSATFGGSDFDEGFSVQQTSGGGYIVTGYTRSYGAGREDVWLIKTDASGNKVWGKTFGGTNADLGRSVQQTSDGGCVIVGSTTSYGAGSIDVWLIKTDASGNKVWDKTFGGTSDDWGYSVQQTSDCGYIIAGMTTSYGAGGVDVWLIKTDASGNRVWDQTFGGPGDDWGYSVQQTTDGGYVITGYAGPHGGWLIKTDALGNRVWDQTFGGAGDDWSFSAQQTSDGGYIIVGTTVLPGALYEDVWLIKTDSLGNKVWDKTFGGPDPDFGTSVQQTSDGGYVFTGYLWQGLTGNYDLRLTKTDASGFLVWERTFGGPGEDWGNSVRTTSDGGYVVVGYAESLGEGTADVYLIKTDAEGN